jgi:hypothetical protein
MIIYARLLPNSSTPRALKERHQHAPKSPQLTSTDCTRKKQVDDGTVQSWLNWSISNGKHLRTIGSSTVSHPLHQDQGSIIWSRCSHEPDEGTNDCVASSHYSTHYTWSGGECILAPCTHRLFYRMFPYAFFWDHTNTMRMLQSRQASDWFEPRLYAHAFGHSIMSSKVVSWINKVINGQLFKGSRRCLRRLMFRMFELIPLRSLATTPYSPCLAPIIRNKSTCVQGWHT